MTMPAAKRCTYQGTSYCIISLTGPKYPWQTKEFAINILDDEGLPDRYLCLRYFGMPDPTMMSSANWKGYDMEYSLTEDHRLFITAVSVMIKQEQLETTETDVWYVSEEQSDKWATRLVLKEPMEIRYEEIQLDEGKVYCQIMSTHYYLGDAPEVERPTPKIVVRSPN